MHQISMQILSLSNPKIPDFSPKRPKSASATAEKRVYLCPDPPFEGIYIHIDPTVWEDVDVRTQIPRIGRYMVD